MKDLFDALLGGLRALESLGRMPTDMGVDKYTDVTAYLQAVEKLQRGGQGKARLHVDGQLDLSIIRHSGSYGLESALLVNDGCVYLEWLNDNYILSDTQREFFAPFDINEADGVWGYMNPSDVERLVREVTSLQPRVVVDGSASVTE